MNPRTPQLANFPCSHSDVSRWTLSEVCGAEDAGRTAAKEKIEAANQKIGAAIDFSSLTLHALSKYKAHAEELEFTTISITFLLQTTMASLRNDCPHCQEHLAAGDVVFAIVVDHTQAD